MDEERISEQPNSVEISTNAKGQISGKVKVYSGTIEEAYSKACEFSDSLTRRIKDKNGF